MRRCNANAGSTRSSIELSILPGKNAAATIPSGVVALLRLKVSDKAAHGYLDMKLQATARAPKSAAGASADA